MRELRFKRFEKAGRNNVTWIRVVLFLLRAAG
jgi:hypothetical protein